MVCLILDEQPSGSQTGPGGTVSISESLVVVVTHLTVGQPNWCVATPSNKFTFCGAEPGCVLPFCCSAADHSEKHFWSECCFCVALCFLLFARAPAPGQLVCGNQTWSQKGEIQTSFMANWAPSETSKHPGDCVLCYKDRMGREMRKEAVQEDK